MEDASYGYKILTRPRTTPDSSASQEEYNVLEDQKTFEEELQAYEESKIHEENSEEWIYDSENGYYYNKSAKIYALWNSDTQEWMYTDNNYTHDSEQNKTEDLLSLNQETKSEENSDNAREEGQLSDSEVCGTTSILSNGKNVNSQGHEPRDVDDFEPNNTHIFTPPTGYLSTSEAQYYFNPENNVWFDTHTGVYSVYDESTQTYTPVEPLYASSSANIEDTAIDHGEPGSDATLRLVVLESEILQLGHLVLVDANGISMGRDRWDDRRLRLAEMPTSKHHCQIFCSSSTVSDNKTEDDDLTTPTNSLDTFFIVDNGSQNGTFVNSKRLSESKMSSKPHQLNHMDELIVGSTKFQVHLHKKWTCDICTVTEGKMIDISQKLDGNASYSKTKPRNGEGDINVNSNSNSNNATQKELLEFQRREELSRLKRKYMGPSSSNQKQVKYVDRAAIRRGIYPDNNPIRKDWEDDPTIYHEKETNVQTKISPDNKGNKLLQKMGWKEGQGLGLNGTGILDPVQLVTNDGTTGLGAGPGRNTKNASETLQEATRRIAKERYIDLFQ